MDNNAHGLSLHVETKSGAHLATLVVPSGGGHMVGSHADVELTVADAALLPRHFEVSQQQAGLVLTPRGPLTINGRPVSGEVLLCGGDRIAAGSSIFSVSVPFGGGYPLARVGDTFWSILAETAGWRMVHGSGLQRNSSGLLENFCMVQDPIGAWPSLNSYIQQQERLQSSVYSSFSANLYKGNDHYGCESTAYLSSDFEFAGKKESQLQFYGLKHDQVGVATWSVPRDLAGDDIRFAHFEALLGLTHFH